MDEAAEIIGPLVSQSMPAMAAALRLRWEWIVNRWDRVVRQLLPDADVLTTQEVRDSIPAILEQMARALEASDPAPTEELTELTSVHGSSRFHESYNVKELIIEYRLLRRILIEEIDGCFEREVTAREWLALDIAVDIALQQAVLSFLGHQRAQLKAATESEAKFLAFLAHDMRGGLNSLMLAMEWVEISLQGRPELAEPREELIRARSSAEETVESMERLLQAERLHQRAAAPRHEEVRFAVVAAKVAAQFGSLARKKSLQLELRVPEEAQARTDEGLLTLILQNLVSNAVKYSERGSVTISADASEGGGWDLRVSDQGVGISEETAAKLFQAFSRGPVRGTEGIGLGLFIVAQAARTIGVLIKLDSKLNEGSAFTITWPTRPASVSVASLP
jgi:signal transduction histidine kinase